ncbi:carboxymuconolactone decarboxylase family protein, partial [Klebsiella pneumoniae]|uniref:carboxymuconolactone decarboxylase family protein n=1 Tax=Klebsiella pneumoniae TaxID=573 RepID=UPI0030139B98
EIERVTKGPEAPGWNEHDRALLRAVDELHRDSMISDATWNTLAKTLNEAQMLEVPMLIGQYQAGAYVHNSLRLHLRPGNPG